MLAHRKAELQRQPGFASLPTNEKAQLRRVPSSDQLIASWKRMRAAQEVEDQDLLLQSISDHVELCSTDLASAVLDRINSTLKTNFTLSQLP